MELTGETKVLAAIKAIGGVPVFSIPVPIWAVVLIEFVLAFTLENLLGSPLSFKFACKISILPLPILYFLRLQSSARLLQLCILR